MGIVKCSRLTNECVWWPNVSNEVKRMVENCTVCLEQQKQRAETFKTTPLPSGPWLMLGKDLMELKKKYFLGNIFAIHGSPQTVRADGGTQFTSYDFKQFAKIMASIQKRSLHVLCSPMGEAEKAVDIAKCILSRSEDSNLGLLAYRSTPLKSVFSPAEILFGRKSRNTLPMRHAQLAPSRNEGALAQFRSRYEAVKYTNKTNHDEKKGIRDLPSLQVGNKVWISDMRRYGQVRNISTAPRSFIVSTEKGQIRRSRRQLIKFTAGSSWNSRRGITTLGKETNPGQVRREKVLMLSNPVQDYL
ncbi:hypothetical protein PR048_008008 [Dryococelus australis]|uniref:Integrase zinc-binding domain-containing protein n=1 Tax=Dryococelus australis TaxID=614101 RepID=A0ABQ9HW72_9NEOP|nr:hypothetical protein PR048_008008 [Dryococelus australis]